MSPVELANIRISTSYALNPPQSLVPTLCPKISPITARTLGPGLASWCLHSFLPCFESCVGF